MTIPVNLHIEEKISHEDNPIPSEAYRVYFTNTFLYTEDLQCSAPTKRLALDGMLEELQKWRKRLDEMEYVACTAIHTEDELAFASRNPESQVNKALDEKEEEGIKECINLLEEEMANDN